MPRICRYLIHNFQIEKGEIDVEIPDGARVFHAAWSGAGIYLFCFVEIDSEQKDRRFLIARTTDDIDCPERCYVASAISDQQGDAHVFDLGPSRNGPRLPNLRG